MIFPVMMFSLGFLCAFLLAIVILPPFIRKSGHRPLTQGQKKRLTSLKQSRAESDRMRAEYAISIRKQEQAAETLRARGQEQLIEIAECRAGIRELKSELSEAAALADRRGKENEDLRARLDAMALAMPKQQAAPKNEDQLPEAKTEAALAGDGADHGKKDTEAGSVSDTGEKTAPAAADPSAPGKQSNGQEEQISGKPRLPGTEATPEAEPKAKAKDKTESQGLAGRIHRLKLST